jgi:membrane-associated protein
MFDVQSIIQSGGLLIIMLIVFAESGMLVGFFLPGDTLLFSAGILAAGGALPLWWTIAAISFAAIAGDNVGYQIGKSLGPRLFKKDSLVFRHDYIMRAEAFYEKHGSKTMLLAHFVPLVRTFVPVTAGAAKMNRRQYIAYDAIGCTAWAVSTTLLGYYLGTRVPGIEKYMEPVLVVVILVFLAPTIFHLLRDPKIRTAIASKLKRR